MYNCLSYMLFSVFETTIRYLAGLLSAYELSNNQYPVLLQKAKEVADKMAFAWVGVSLPMKFKLHCIEAIA
jgi:Glycosyl hydrolase family 47